MLRLLVGFALTTIAAWGGGTKGVRNNPQAVTVGGSGDALDRSAVSLTAPGPRGCYDPADFGATTRRWDRRSLPSQQALDAASSQVGESVLAPDDGSCPVHRLARTTALRRSRPMACTLR